MISMETFRKKVCWYDFEFNFNKHHDSFMNQINNFTEKMLNKGQSSQYYFKQRNASFPKKDIEIGKYGEFAASLILHSGKITLDRFPALMPDFEIRKGGSKGWDCDLPFSIKDKNFPDCHVKTCDQNSSDFVNRASGGSSKYTWTFQYGNVSGNGGRDELFFKPDSEELILFMFVPFLEGKKAKIVASAPWNKLQKIIKDPIASKFKGIKKCIYSEDLIALSKQEVILKNF